METKISLLSNVLPHYGELLIAVGAIAVEERELLENKIARERLKNFLISEAHKVRSANNLGKSLTFQKIIYDYVGKCVAAMALKNKIPEDKMSTINVIAIFVTFIWPEIVDRYMDNICNSSIDIATITVIVPEKKYVTIYGTNQVKTFFTELKEFLIDNYIVISKAQMMVNNDMLFEFKIPIAARSSD